MYIVTGEVMVEFTNIVLFLFFEFIDLNFLLQFVYGSLQYGSIYDLFWYAISLFQIVFSQICFC